MERRRFMKTAALGVTAVVAGAAGYASLKRGDGAALLSIDAALKKIDALTMQKLASSGKWSPHQIFSHCAQTVEYSMSGYPAPKSALFQHTVGTLAHSVFSIRHKMTHDLSAPIAGAPPLEVGLDATAGLARLRQAFIKFQQFNGTLAPHFAYGMLTKEEYAMAHAMHFSNHLDEITALS